MYICPRFQQLLGDGDVTAFACMHQSSRCARTSHIESVDVYLSFLQQISNSCKVAVHASRVQQRDERGLHCRIAKWLYRCFERH